jgi:hypothetical protein
LGDSVECPEGSCPGSLDDQAKVIAQHLCAASPRMFVAAEMAPAI